MFVPGAIELVGAAAKQSSTNTVSSMTRRGRINGKTRHCQFDAAVAGFEFNFKNLLLKHQKR